MRATASLPFEQVIVVGGTGQTGRRLVELFLEGGVTTLVATCRGGTGPEPRARWVALDLEAEEPALEKRLAALEAGLRAGAPTALVLAAAFTNVEGCETDPAHCDRVNVRNSIAVMSWARRRFGAKLAFYSTDYVFDGAEGPYAETARRNPLSVYGRAKAQVEEWLEAEAPDALILRTTGVYDELAGSKNFLMQILTMLGEKKPPRVPSDQWANPVWALELARATVELLARGEAGIFHVAGATQLARVEFARVIASVFGFDPALVTSIETAALAQKARRPLRGGLLCAKLRACLGWAPGGARETLEHIKARRGVV